LNPFTVQVLVTVEVTETSPRGRDAEALLTREAVGLVAEAVRRETAIRLLDAHEFGYDDCGFVGEAGIDINVGLPAPVCLHDDGSWSYTPPGGEPVSGSNFASLSRYVLAHLPPT
jgi:hypothetical protein